MAGYLCSMIELERTFLARRLPVDLSKAPSKDIIDVYLPLQSRHPILRLRKNGDRCVITKKQPEKKGEHSHLKEETIVLSPEEFAALNTVTGKKVHKKRYAYPWKDKTIEIDVFQGPLTGLVLVDVEFRTEEEKQAFRMPPFCLVEITQEEFIAGGMLCGKSYADIAKDLARFSYKPLVLE